MIHQKKFPNNIVPIFSLTVFYTIVYISKVLSKKSST